MSHVWSGRLAVLWRAVAMLPALRFRPATAGCCGIFVVRLLLLRRLRRQMILLTRKNLRAWVIPVLGRLVFFTLVNIWLTSALWIFKIQRTYW